MYKSTAIIVLVASVISFLLGSILGSTSVQNSWRLDAAQTSCAQFNPLNGHFEWIEVSK